MPNDRIAPRTRHDFSIALICALPLEASIVSELFDARYDTGKYGKGQVDTNAYSLGVLGPHDVVLVHMPNMGKVAAATAAANLRASFRGIQLALVVGICGGAPFGPSGELLLGDVVISEGLVQYDLGRRLPHAFVRKNTPVESLPRPKPEVRATLAKLQTSQGRYQLQNEMLEHLRLLRQRSALTIPYPGPINDQLFKPKYLHRHRPPSECAICANVDGDDVCSSAIEASCEELGCRELDPRPRSRLIQTSNESQPVIHFGLVASGDTVMRSGNDRDKIVTRDKVIAFEMEGAGVWEMFPAALVIKGVCDYADSHKNKTWQSYAAATAAAAAKAFLEHWNMTFSREPRSPQHLQDSSTGHAKSRQFGTRELAIMKRLYTSPYRDRKERNPDRVAGTCEWFTQHHLFQDWKESTSSRLLWVSADPGCGKSVLVKYLVDHVLLSTPSMTVCYFFFKDDFEDQKNIFSALCCILYQLFQQNPALLSEAIANQFEAGGERFLASFSELWNILLTAAQDVHSGEIICILDAIDECEDHGRSQLAKELCKLYGAESRLKLNLKFLVTSRPFGKIRQGFQPLQIPGLPIIHLSGESEEELKKISAEIDTYIKARVQDISERLKLERKERRTLLKELLRVPNRTYLWVYLILDLVESDIHIDRTGILQATTHIPRTVDEAYDKILSRSSNFQMATRMLHIILAAERALTLTELGFALAIRRYHQSHDEIDIKSEDRLRENIRDACGLFVTIIHSKVYLLHQTAREFLVCNTKSQSTSSINSALKWKHRLLPQESHNILAKICIRYLLLSHQDAKPLSKFSEDGETQSTDRRILWDYSANYWATHTRESQVQTRSSMTQSILKICDTSSNCEAWLRTFWKKTNTAFPEKFTTLMIVSYFGLDAAVKMMLSTMTSDVELKARDETYGRSALSWAAGNGFNAVVKLLSRGNRGWRRKINLLLSGNSSEINSVDASGRTPLLYAIWNGDVAVVRALLNAGAQTDLTDNIGGTPLFYAMSYRREAIVKLLIENGATPKSKDKMATQLFFSAVENGDVQVVQLFLDSSIDIESRESNGMTPLLLAMKKRHLHIMQLLLTHGANIESRDEFDNTPLAIAAEYGNAYDIQLLLDYGANIEAYHHHTPLLAAAEAGYLDAVQVLLERGADINARNKQGLTPIALAASHEHRHVAQFLLNQGASVKVMDENGRTPLSHATETNESKAIVLFLLDHAADIEAADINGMTPLFYAIKRDSLNIVHHLLERGANIEAADVNGLTPLFYAIKRDSLNIVHHLLERGANIEAADVNGLTPLFYAIKRVRLLIVQHLLKSGANIEATDLDGLTPLFYAVRRGVLNIIHPNRRARLNIIQHLLESGANIEARDKDGRTPLFEAVLCLRKIVGKNQFFGFFLGATLETINLLLEKGAEIDAVDSYGQTPLSYAAASEDASLVQLLVSRGAKHSTNEDPHQGQRQSIERTG